MAEKKKNAVKDTFVLLGRVARLYKPVAWQMLPGLLFHTSQNFAVNYTMSLLLSMLTAAIISGAMSGVYRALLTFVLMFCGFLLALVVSFYFMLQGQVKTNRTVKLKMLDQLLRRRITPDHADHTGDALSRMGSDAGLMLDGIFWQVDSMVMALWTILGSSVVVFGVDWRLGLLCIGVGLVSVGINTLLVGPFRRNADAIQQHTSRANQRLSDIIAGGLTLRLFDLFERKNSVFAQEARQIVRRENRNTRLGLIRAAKDAWQEWASVAGILAVGLLLVAKGEITLPALMMIPSMSASIVYGLGWLGNVFNELQGSLAGAARALAVLDMPLEDQRPSLPDPTVTPGDWALELDEVSFGYSDENEPALAGLTLQVRPGEMVALVGQSGSGKSTLFRLLLGLYVPDKGRIRLYGQDMVNRSLNGWRRLFAYVAQESPLFDASLGENIAMGLGGQATAGQVEQAARAADIWDFIESNGGVDAAAGELGARLSGGQRQRVAIARALVRNAPILLLDEATSSLDAEAERQVQQSIDQLVRGRTVLVAAHRLSTIRSADRIVVLERGRVIEEGSHDALLAQDGAYARLWRSQSFPQAAEI